MTLTEIMDAIIAGKTVCWKTIEFEVVCYPAGVFNIVNIKTHNCTPLVWSDGVTLNCNEEDFFIKDKEQLLSFNEIRPYLIIDCLTDYGIMDDYVIKIKSEFAGKFLVVNNIRTILDLNTNITKINVLVNNNDVIRIIRSVHNSKVFKVYKLVEIK